MGFWRDTALVGIAVLGIVGLCCICVVVGGHGGRGRFCGCSVVMEMVVVFQSILKMLRGVEFGF